MTAFYNLKKPGLRGKSPNTPNASAKVLIEIKRVPSVEILDPREDRRIVGRLGRTPVVIIGKTTDSIFIVIQAIKLAGGRIVISGR